MEAWNSFAEASPCPEPIDVKKIKERKGAARRIWTHCVAPARSLQNQFDTVIAASMLRMLPGRAGPYVAVA